MTYVHVTRTPGMTIADYHRVNDAMAGEPIKGRQAHYAGEQSGMLLVVDVWDSQADADRFAGERLFPAFEAAGVRPSAETLVLAFDPTSVDA